MNYLIVLLTAFLFSGGNEILNEEAGQNQDKCLKKTSSEWAGNCASCYNSSESYRVNLTNVCDVVIDVKVAVEEKTTRWRIFNMNNLAPGDSISAYACVGTGKYVFWTKTAGDKSVLFPTDDEIQEQFAKQ